MATEQVVSRSSGPVARSRRSARAAERTGLYIALTIVGVIMAFPFYWMVVGSMMEPVELYSSTPHLWPENFNIDAYQRIFQLMPIGRFYLNSIIVASVTVVIGTLVCSAAGYCFAHLHFIGRRFWFLIIIATLMVPYQSRIIPLFVMFSHYGLTNTYAGLIIPGLASAFGLFMMTQFFKEIPGELRSAALIDGAGEMRVFFLVYLPLARPAVATLALLMFIQSWDDLLWPLIIAPEPQMRTLQVGLAFINQYAPTLNYTMAGIVVSVIPVIVAFLIVQKQLVAGIAAGAIKE